MLIGVPKETKPDENRVAITPEGVEVMRRNGHEILVQASAGSASGFTEDAYARSGARIIDSMEEIFARADMILRVKAPQPAETVLLRKGQIYFSYLHLAASEAATRALVDSECVAFGYETIQKANGALPLLKPMSEVAGPMAIQEGAKYLEMAQGGHGVLLGGVPGADPGMVLILGGGVVGMNAARMAAGLGARVYILEVDLDRMRYLSDIMPGNCFVVMSSPAAVRELLPRADVVVGAVLVPGSRTPVMVTRDMLGLLRPGSVLVDVAIDQGGCFETSRETTHQTPTYELDGIIHYAVSNMPGALPRTSTLALTNATLPYVLEIAGKGWRQAMTENPEIRMGANVALGKITYQAVADVFGLPHTPAEEVMQE